MRKRSASSEYRSNEATVIPGFRDERHTHRGSDDSLPAQRLRSSLVDSPWFPQTHVIWHKIANRQSETYTVVLTDLRGYGASSKPEGGPRHENYSFRAMAQDQIDVMRHLGHHNFFIGAPDPTFFLNAHFEVQNGTPGALTDEAVAEYRRCFCKPETIHAACEDYRAAAQIDLEMDEADEKAGRKVEAPLLALWGGKGLVD